MPALSEALGQGGEDELEVLLGDTPETLDCAATLDKFKNLKAVGGDLLHLAMKVEESTGEHVSEVSSRLRKCLNRGHVPYDDGQPYYRKGLPPAPGLEPWPQPSRR